MRFGEILADGARIAFLFVQAPIVGALLLLAMAGITGARWPAFATVSRLQPLVLAGAALLGLAQLATPAPPHLSIWMNPLAVGARGVFVGAALWHGARCLGRTPSTNAAAAFLAVYAVAVTPVAFDWLLGHVPGHAVSSAGMMLAVGQVAGATALALLLGLGSTIFRRDMARLMIAAALGLGYLFFMDYLITWFGNLPGRAGFHLARIGPLPPLALLLGWVAPILLLATGRQALAGASTLSALFLAYCWWIGGGIGAAAVALVLVVLLVASSRRWLAAHQVAHD